MTLDKEPKATRELSGRRARKGIEESRDRKAIPEPQEQGGRQEQKATRGLSGRRGRKVMQGHVGRPAPKVRREYRALLALPVRPDLRVLPAQSALRDLLDRDRSSYARGARTRTQ